MKQKPFLYDATERIKQSLRSSLVFSLACNLLMLALPLYSLQVFDRVLSSYSIDTLLMLSVLAVGAFIFFGIFYAVRSFITLQVGEWMERDLAPKILSHSVEHSVQFSQGIGTQNLRDLQAVKGFIVSPAFQTVLDAPWAPLFILIVFLISPLLGIVTIVGAFLLLAFAWMTEIATRELSDQASEQNLKVMEVSDMAHRNAELVVAMGMMPGMQRAWADANREMQVTQALSSARSTIITSITKSVRMLIQVLIIGLGAWLAINNQLSMGGMIATSILTGRALAPFEAAIGIWRTVLQARHAYGRLNEQMAPKGHERGDMTYPRPAGTLKGENVVAKMGDRMILRGVSFVVEPGEALGIIGQSSAGKSSLCKILAGVWPTSDGTVRLDGIDLFQWKREDAGKYIGYLPQNVDVFQGTIRQNIARFIEDATDEEVVDAAQKAGAHELILRFPNAYDTMIGPGLSSVAPGQKQRIGLARALFRRPSLLIMDEPNSNLDGDGERALIGAIQACKDQGTTVVMVAHKPSLITHMDKILALSGGRVEAFGGREEVLQRYVPQGAAQTDAKTPSEPADVSPYAGKFRPTATKPKKPVYQVSFSDEEEENKS